MLLSKKTLPNDFTASASESTTNDANVSLHFITALWNLYITKYPLIQLLLLWFKFCISHCFGSTFFQDLGQYDFSSSPVIEWTPQQVAQWLAVLKLDSYSDEFIAQEIDGSQLINLDSARYKVINNIYCFVNDFSQIKNSRLEISGLVEVQN